MFQIVFLGQPLPGHDPAVVQQKLAALLKTDSAAVQSLFGRESVIEKKPNRAAADQYHATLTELGAACAVRPLAAAPSVTPPWYENKARVVLLLVLVFPVGLYGLWKNSAFSQKTKGIVSGVVGVVVLAVTGADKTPNAPPPVAAVAAPAPAPVPATVPVSTDLAFINIRRAMETQTDLQFEEYARSLKGKRIRWRGYVEEVREKMFGGYEVWIDMDPPHAPLSVQDVTFAVPKAQALRLDKDDSLLFEGTIARVGSLLGATVQIDLQDVQILP